MKTFDKEMMNHQELEPSGIAIQTIMRTVTACSLGTRSNEEADLEKFLVGFQGIVEDHCDDDDGSSEIKQRWADMEDTDTDDMSPDAVHDDISGQQLDSTLVREARIKRARRFGQHGSLGHCGQG